MDRRTNLGRSGSRMMLGALLIFTLFLVLLSVIASPGDSEAQDAADGSIYLPVILTDVRYWSIAINSGNFVATSDGGLVLLGEQEDAAGNSAQARVARLSRDSVVVWEKLFESDLFYETVNDGLETADGDYVVAGTRQYDAWVARLGGDGTVIWQRTYRDFERDRLNAIEKTADGGWIVVGSTFNGWRSTRPIVLKLASNGAVQWQRVLGEERYERYASANHIQQVADGGYIVAGSDSSTYGPSFDWIMRLDDSGNIVWQRSLTNLFNQYAATTDGGILIAGSVTTGADQDAWLMKLGSDGEIIWQKRYGGDGHDSAKAVGQTSNGGYLLAGSSSSFGVGIESDAWLVKLDGKGELLWEHIYPGIESVPTYATAVAESTDGDIYLGVTGAGYDILRLNSNGEIHDCPIYTDSAATSAEVSQTISDLDWTTDWWSGTTQELTDEPFNGHSEAAPICPA